MIAVNQIRIRMNFGTDGPSHQFLPKDILSLAFVANYSYEE